MLTLHTLTTASLSHDPPTWAALGRVANGDVSNARMICPATVQEPVAEKTSKVSGWYLGKERRIL